MLILYRMSKKERLDASARHVLTKEGLAGFTMERLAEAAGVSRPTAYQYFNSREGALASTAAQTLALCRDLYEGARSFDGDARGKTFAYLTAYEILARCEPEHMEILELLGLPSIRDSLQETQRLTLRAQLVEYTGYLTELVKSACLSGDLKLPESCTVESVVFHSLNFCRGNGLTIARRRLLFSMYGGEAPWEEAQRALFYYWSGIGWTPLLSKEEIAILHERILKQCFPSHWLQLKTEELRRNLNMPLPEKPAYEIPEPRPKRKSAKMPLEPVLESPPEIPL